jgi:3-oxoadipate enol-lactonase
VTSRVPAHRTPVTDVGSGPPLVLVPGIQGRWEWMRPTVAALSRRFRVLTFTLAGEKTSPHAFEDRLGFDSFVVQLDRVLDEAHVPGAIICGVSYGGLIALRYAALRPARVTALTLVSALPPDYEPDDTTRRYLRAPRLMAPVFCVRAVSRALPELRSALPSWRTRVAFAARQLGQVARAPMAPTLMRDRVRLLHDVDFNESARACTAPALLVTGEPTLDRVVKVESTLRYKELLTDARVERLEGTGHLGLVLRPDEFAARIARFAEEVEERRRDARRRTG